MTPASPWIGATRPVGWVELFALPILRASASSGRTDIGRTCCWLDPVANDPLLTWEAVPLSRRESKTVSRNGRIARLVYSCSSCVRMGSSEVCRVPTNSTNDWIGSRGRRAKAVSTEAGRCELIHQRCKAVDMPLGPTDGGGTRQRHCSTTRRSPPADRSPSWSVTPMSRFHPKLCCSRSP